MSWHFSRALVAEYSEANSSGGEPSAPWNLSPSAPDDSCSDKMKGTCHRSPFGTMFVPSTDAHGEALLTWYRAASLARTSAPPGAAMDSTANDPAFGGKCGAWFARWDRDSCSWKTPQFSLLGGLTEFSATWPRWGSMRNGECSERTPMAHRINATASGSWPTPLKSDAVARRPSAGWEGTSDLPSVVWRRNGGEENPSKPPVKLNPGWVEWLMGWPLGWTESRPLETDRFQEWLRSHGER
jgi:hypothetical protein